MPPTKYKVADGDDAASIAAKFGFADASAIWDDPANAELKEQRPGPELLHPGDIVVVPERKEKFESASEKKLNKYKVTIPERELRFVLRDQTGKPRAKVAYTLIVGKEEIKGETTGDGEIKHKLSALLPSVILRFADGVDHELLIGHLNPMRATADNAVSGIAQRLRGLGYYSGPADGTDAEGLASAIRAFERENELKITGSPSPELIDALEKEYGC